MSSKYIWKFGYSHLLHLYFLVSSLQELQISSQIFIWWKSVKCYFNSICSTIYMDIIQLLSFNKTSCSFVIVSQINIHFADADELKRRHLWYCKEWSALLLDICLVIFCWKWQCSASLSCRVFRLDCFFFLLFFYFCFLLFLQYCTKVVGPLISKSLNSTKSLVVVWPSLPSGSSLTTAFCHNSSLFCHLPSLIIILPK